MYKNSPFAAHVAVAETDWGVLHNELELSRAGFREPVCLGSRYVRSVCARSHQTRSLAARRRARVRLSEAERRPNIGRSNGGFTIDLNGPGPIKEMKRL